MVKLKPSEVDIDPDELEDADEGEQQEFDDYEGEIPPANTILIFRVKKMWWTVTSDEKFRMIKAILIAEANTGTKKQYNGLPMWENLSLNPAAAFRYKPFLRALGITVHDIKKKLYLADEDEVISGQEVAPIEKIATLVPGEDSALLRAVTKRDKYQGAVTAKGARYLPLNVADEDEDADADEDEEEAKPASRRRSPSRAKASSRRARDEEDEPDEDEPDEDEEEAPRSRARKPAGRTRGSKRSKPADDDEDDDPPF